MMGLRTREGLYNEADTFYYYLKNILISAKIFDVGSKPSQLKKTKEDNLI